MKRKFSEDYFQGAGSHYKCGYTWDTVGYLLWNRFKEIFLYSRYRHGRWLDAGCAKGFLLRIASQYGWEPFGFDISPYAVHQAKKICPNAHLFVLDAQQRFPFTNEYFEVITACELVEHLSEPQIFLEEAYRLLKPDGLLFISTPNPSSIFSLSLPKGIIRIIGYTTPFADETHISYFNAKSIEKALKKCGFSKVETKYAFDILWRVSIHTPSPFGWTLLAFAHR